MSPRGTTALLLLLTVAFQRCDSSVRQVPSETVSPPEESLELYGSSNDRPNLRQLPNFVAAYNEFTNRYSVRWEQCEATSCRRIQVTLDKEMGAVMELRGPDSADTMLGKLNFVYFGNLNECTKLMRQQIPPTSGVVFWLVVAQIWPITNILLADIAKTGNPVEYHFKCKYNNAVADLIFLYEYSFIHGSFANYDFMFTQNYVEISQLFEGVRVNTRLTAEHDNVEKIFGFRSYRALGAINFFRLNNFVFAFSDGKPNFIWVCWKENAVIKLLVEQNKIQKVKVLPMDDASLPSCLWSPRRIQIHSESLWLSDVIQTIASFRR